MKEDNDWSSAVCHTVCQRLFLRMCFCMRLIWLSQHVNWLPRLMSKNVKIMKSKPVDIWTHLVCLEAEYTRDTGIPKNCNLNGKNMQNSFKIYYIYNTNKFWLLYFQTKPVDVFWIMLIFCGAGMGKAHHTWRGLTCIFLQYNDGLWAAREMGEWLGHKPKISQFIRP